MSEIKYDMSATIEELNAKKEDARHHFEEMTRKHGIRHTFSFDEAWNFVVAQRYRLGVIDFQHALEDSPYAMDKKTMDELNPLRHSFADGCYIREITNPPNELIVTKIHKITHPFFLLEGDMTILTEHGPKRIKAPYHGITKAGTKRVIYTHAKCVFVTVHVTNETDLDKIEEQVIAQDFDEVPLDKQDEILKFLQEEQS